MPIKIVTSETRRPNPLNSPIITSGCPSDLSDKAGDAGIDAETRVAFGMSSTPKLFR
jgi:hypothetical protein